MLLGKIRTLMAFACLVLFSDLPAQQTYSQQYNSASQRRAESSIEQFRAKLSQAKSSGEHPKTRILLSFNSLVPANDVIGGMRNLGIVLEDLQVSIGEEVHSFGVQKQDLRTVQASVRKELEQAMANREGSINTMLTNETDDRAKYWMKDDLRLLRKFKERLQGSEELLISGVGCVASTEQIENLMREFPSLIRAIEFQGSLRMMSIPVEVNKGPEE